MLEQQDLKMLEQVMQGVVEKNNGVIKQYVDESIEGSIEKNNEVIKQYVDESVERSIEKNNEVIKQYVDESVERSIKKNNRVIKEYIKEEITHSEKFLLDEIDRFHRFTKRDIEKLNDKVCEIAEYYRIKKSEEDRVNTLFYLYQKQQQEIDGIKSVIAI